MRKQAKPRRSREEKLTHNEHRVRLRAMKRGLFILFDGPANARKWNVYSKSSGKQIGWYSNKTGTYHVGDETGTETFHNAVIEIFARAGEV